MTDKHEKIGTDGDKMEKLINYQMHIHYHKKASFWKRKNLSQVTVKQSTVFFLWIIAFKTDPRSNWEIQMDWENEKW